MKKYLAILLLSSAIANSQTIVKIYNDSKFVLQIDDIWTINMNFNQANSGSFQKMHRINKKIHIMPQEIYVMENTSSPTNFPFYSPNSVPNFDTWGVSTVDFTIQPQPNLNWITYSSVTIQSEANKDRQKQRLLIFKSKMLKDFYDEEHFTVMPGEWYLGDTDFSDMHSSYSDGENYEVIYWKTVDSNGNFQYNFYCH